MSEKNLIKQIMLGDEAATKKFCWIYRKKLERFVGRKIGDLGDVEEIVQDTLMSGLDSLSGFKGNCSLFTWLCSIARHEIADFYRRKKIKQIVFSRFPFLEKLVSEALGPELAFQELETKKKIVKTFKNLSEGYSQILRLKYIEELSMKQIAEKLGETVKAVESRLFRARMAFQKIYDSKKSEKFGENRDFTGD